MKGARWVWVHGFGALKRCVEGRTLPWCARAKRGQGAAGVLPACVAAREGTARGQHAVPRGLFREAMLDAKQKVGAVKKVPFQEHCAGGAGRAGSASGGAVCCGTAGTARTARSESPTRCVSAPWAWLVLLSHPKGKLPTYTTLQHGSGLQTTLPYAPPRHTCFQPSRKSAQLALHRVLRCALLPPWHERVPQHRSTKHASSSCRASGALQSDSLTTTRPSRRWT